MKKLFYITGVVLTLAGLASLMFGASDLFAALLLACGLLSALLGVTRIRRSRKAAITTFLPAAFLAGYLIYEAAGASQPLLAFAALRSIWVGVPLILVIGCFAILFMRLLEKEANQALLPTPTAVTPAASHPSRQP